MDGKNIADYEKLEELEREEEMLEKARQNEEMSDEEDEDLP